MALRVDLADILLGDDDVLCLGAGDHDLMVLLVGLLLVLLKIRLKLADDVPFHLLGVRANVIKIDVNFRRVERRKDIHSHLVQGEHAAADQCHDEHHRRNGTPHGKDDRIHRANSHMTRGRQQIQARDRTEQAHTRSRRAGVVCKDDLRGTTRGRRARPFPRGKATYGSAKGARAFINNAAGAAPESERRGRHSAAA